MSMNKVSKRYPGQPENEIWFYDKDMPYYWLTNFYENVIKIDYIPITPSHNLAILKGVIPVRVFDEKGRINEKIDEGKFFKKKDYFLETNHWAWSSLGVFPTNWLSSEHLFQALKFSSSVSKEQIEGWRREGIIIEIFKAENARRARAIAERYKDYWRSDWHSGEIFEKRDEKGFVNYCRVVWKESAMLWVVREKFKNPELREKLWKTGTKKLVEHSPHDNFWGDGGDGNGKNMLGEILMEIREEIIAEKGECPEAQIVDESEISGKDTKDKDKKGLIEKNIQEIHAKLQSSKISSEQEIKILGNVWETDYQINWMTLSQEQIENASKESLRKIDEWMTENKDSERDGPSEDNSDENKKPNEPNNPDKKKIGRQEIPVSPSLVKNDQIKSELNAAIETDNVDDIINVLKNNQENIINSTDEGLKKAAKNLEDKLIDNNKSSLEYFKSQIQTVLDQEEKKAYDLPVPVRQKYSELGNNKINNSNLRDEIIQAIVNQSLHEVVVALEEALSENNITEIKGKEQKLRNFVNSKIGYREQVIQNCQGKIDYLFQRTQQSLVFLNKNNNDDSPFFRVNNLLLYGFIIAFVGVVMLVRKLRLKRV